ncbi:hypothetical protein BHF71_07945 [Vulcanibacillus modesticaldus]|uniref:DUF4446 domain-containing protein n=1 Tax=Vulcanibacillus modesticaldus TaxID=337097 RepID=A0A1D2YVI8_9BACI|nr:hypothetical protein BHF71_07945 [Vulcanibacillus modesticaldus]
MWNTTLSIKLKRVSKKINIFTKGASIKSLEEVIVEYVNEAEMIKNKIKNNEKQIDLILNKVKELKGNVAIIRYNAFGEQGNDLSYSIAFLDENKDGIVISSIYNRGESNTYAKPIKNGSSTYKLSKEELDVIEKAMKN